MLLTESLPHIDWPELYARLREMGKPYDKVFADVQMLPNSNEILQAGEYEDFAMKNSTWSTGDWNGDGDFDSLDLTIALQSGRYEINNRYQMVPEPTTWLLALCGFFANFFSRARQLSLYRHGTTIGPQRPWLEYEQVQMLSK